MCDQESFSEAVMSAKELEWFSKIEAVGKESTDSQVWKRKGLFLKCKRRKKNGHEAKWIDKFQVKWFFIRDFIQEN